MMFIVLFLKLEKKYLIYVKQIVEMSLHKPIKLSSVDYIG